MDAVGRFLDALPRPTMDSYIISMVLLTILFFATFAAGARLLRSRERHRKRDASPQSARPPDVLRTQPKTNPAGPRRRKPELEPSDAVAIARYPTLLANAAAGRGGHELPPVVHRNMQLPEEERADFRQLIAEPFEASYFQAQCAWLRLTMGETRWWQWLKGDGLARFLYDSIVTDLLSTAPDEERQHCTALLGEWLLQGALDDFAALRKTLAELEETSGGRDVTVKEIHEREIDALERMYSKDWLLASVLRTLMPVLRAQGVIAARPPRATCPACIATYDPTAPGHVRLVAFLPCVHWYCHACFASVRRKTPGQVATAGQEARCPVCNVEALPMPRDWPGAMIHMG